MDRAIALEKNNFITKNQVKAMVLFIGLLSAATLLPFLKQQLVVGTLVNTTLFLGAALLGPYAAMTIGLIPSLVSISVGLLPPVLAPMIPFIMVGNSILIMLFSQIRSKNQWLAMVVASVCKFIFLASVSNIVISLIINKTLAPKITLMMSWLQLGTALAGGLLAVSILMMVERKKTSPRMDD